MPSTATLTVARLCKVPTPPVINPLTADAAARATATSALVLAAFNTPVAIVTPGLVLRQQLVEVAKSNDGKTAEEFANHLAAVIEGYVGCVLGTVAGHIDFAFNTHGHAGIFPVAPPPLNPPPPPPFL
jgi:hypothetical protein